MRENVNSVKKKILLNYFASSKTYIILNNILLKNLKIRNCLFFKYFGMSLFYQIRAERWDDDIIEHIVNSDRGNVNQMK